jgi:hypothetical protein
MRSVLSFLLVILAHGLLSAETKAQTQDPACPHVEIRSKEGQRVPRFQACFHYEVTLTANISKVAPEDKPTFNWTVSSGKIVSGQGTSTITITAGETIEEAVTVTVEVSGVSALTPECDHRASEVIGFSEPCCPTISISCPTDILRLDEPMTFSANISGGDPNMNPKYNWQVSAGRIISGQGTLQISVDRSGIEGESITATVEVDGLPPECDRTQSCSTTWIASEPVAEARKFDEYGEVSFVNEETRLSNFEAQLQQEPGAQGYVIVYGPRRVKPHIARVRKFLIEKRGLEPSRIVLMDGGYSKKTKVELWIVPTGATPPKPNPRF